MDQRRFLFGLTISWLFPTDFFKGNREPATFDSLLLEDGLALAFHRADGIGLWVGLVVRIWGVCVDSGDVGLAWIEEIESDHGLVRLLAGHVADEPLACVFGLAGHGDIFPWLSLQIAAFRPVDGHILDEFERVREPLVVLGKVSGHLERGTHHHLDAELVGYRAVSVRVVLWIDLGDVHLEDSRGIIHRTADESGERKD